MDKKKKNKDTQSSDAVPLITTHFDEQCFTVKKFLLKCVSTFNVKLFICTYRAYLHHEIKK